MKFYRFVNHNKHLVQLTGPHKEVVKVGAGKEITLPDYYIKYCPKYIRVISSTSETQDQQNNIKKIPVESTYVKTKLSRPDKQPIINKVKRGGVRQVSISNTKTKRSPNIVGRSSGSHVTATNKFKNLIKDESFAISNNIGVGILSYNRLSTIKRLLDSIKAHTDLSKTTIFVSDESDKQEVKSYLKSVKWIVLLDNQDRLGIAGNSNRLLQCLSRFKHKILLNDDVEIKKDGWDKFYFDAMKTTGMHHFCYRQDGVYGANSSQIKTSSNNGYKINTIQDKPQGAVMVFDDVAFDKVGYFDIGFGIYGMEHVDWSNRVSMSGVQMPGFHDVGGSEQYFTIHNEPTSIKAKHVELSESKKKFNEVKTDRSRIYINQDSKSVVPSLSYVVPYRHGQDRKNAIKSVISNIRAQKFPHIEIVLVEQDNIQQQNEQSLMPITYKFLKGDGDFWKSAAFNAGVKNASNALIVLHDADMIVQRNYSELVYRILQDFESCHIGRHVLYLDAESTNKICSSLRVDDQLKCDRIVGYFEGGSLACHKNVFINIGGFNEQFKGYGCEDCEFYERLSRLTKMYDGRSIDLIHLNHGRSSGWNAAHKQNKLIHTKLSRMPLNNRTQILRSELKSKYNI
ncbi:MAG: glycosyltransferase [Candidatus Lokiarchaeota archaeon]|nr:glycosyltransferase [Candidatus Lokiarchaeota archaeon]